MQHWNIVQGQNSDVNTRVVPVSEPHCIETSLSRPSSLLWLVLADSSINCALQEVAVIIDKCPRYRVITLGNRRQAWYHDVLCDAYVMGSMKKRAELQDKIVQWGGARRRRIRRDVVLCSVIFTDVSE
jgi:hypothetical protein